MELAIAFSVSQRKQRVRMSKRHHSIICNAREVFWQNKARSPKRSFEAQRGLWLRLHGMGMGRIRGSKEFSFLALITVN
jgi:hypothetical protein